MDEVGRGPLAGPIVAAAVILKKEHGILGLKDSKKLSPKKRSSLFAEIFTQRLLETKLTPNSEIMAIKIGMLSSRYNTIISNPLAINALEPIIFAFTHALCSLCFLFFSVS